MKATDRIKIAGRELVKGNLGNVVKSFTLPESTLLQSSSYRGLGGNGFWLFGAGGSGEDIHFSYSSLNDALRAFYKCPPLASILNRKAQAHITGRTWVLNRSGEQAGKEATSADAVKLRKLLEKPNPVQNWLQFEAQIKVYVSLFGFCPILPIVPVGFPLIDASALWILPPWLMEIEESDELFYTEADTLIKSIKFRYKNKTAQLDPKSIFFIKDITIGSCSVMLPDSRVKSLTVPIKNIIGALDSRHVLIKRRGALGILSNAAKDQVGNVPLDELEKQKVEEELMRYGLGLDQWQVIVTNATLNWQQMGYPTKDLMLFEEIEDSTQALCDGFGYPFRLLSYYKGGSLAGSDVAEFKKMLYVDFIIPEAKSIYDQLNALFKTVDHNLILDKDFSDNPVLQEDARKEAMARKTLNDALSIEWEKGLITLDEWKIKLGDDPLPDGKGQIRATDPKDSNVPLAVTIGVGGVQGLIEVITAQGMTDEARQATLEIVFGLKPEDASRMAVSATATPEQGGAGNNSSNPENNSNGN